MTVNVLFSINPKYLPPANRVCGKVIFLQVCVCPQGGWCVRLHTPSPGLHTPSPGLRAPPGLRTPPRLCAPQDYIPPQTTYPPWTTYPPDYIPPLDYVPPSVDGLCAGGTHPTGKHSCLYLQLQF